MSSLNPHHLRPWVLGGFSSYRGGHKDSEQAVVCPGSQCCAEPGATSRFTPTLTSDRAFPHLKSQVIPPLDAFQTHPGRQAFLSWTRNARDLCASFAAFRAFCTPAPVAGLRRPRRQVAERAVGPPALRPEPRRACCSGRRPTAAAGALTDSLKGDFSSAVAAEGDEGPVRP